MRKLKTDREAEELQSALQILRHGESFSVDLYSIRQIYLIYFLKVRRAPIKEVFAFKKSEAYRLIETDSHLLSQLPEAIPMLKALFDVLSDHNFLRGTTPHSGIMAARRGLRKYDRAMGLRVVISTALNKHKAAQQ